MKLKARRSGKSRALNAYKAWLNAKPIDGIEYDRAKTARYRNQFDIDHKWKNKVWFI